MGNRIVERIDSLQKDEIEQSFLVFCMEPVGVYLVRNRCALAISLFDAYSRFLAGEDVAACIVREFGSKIIGFDIAFDMGSDKIFRFILDSHGEQRAVFVSIRYLVTLDCAYCDAETVHNEYKRLTGSGLLTDKIRYLVDERSRDLS